MLGHGVPARAAATLGAARPHTLRAWRSNAKASTARRNAQKRLDSHGSASNETRTYFTNPRRARHWRNTGRIRPDETLPLQRHRLASSMLACARAHVLLALPSQAPLCGLPTRTLRYIAVLLEVGGLRSSRDRESSTVTATRQRHFLARRHN